MDERATRGDWLDSVPIWSAIAATGLVLVGLVWGLLTHSYHAWPVALLLLSGLIVLGMGAMLLVALIVFGISIVFLLKKWRSVGLRSTRPLIVLLGAALIWVYAPHVIAGGYWLARQGSFERVILDVEAGQLVPSDEGLLHLPHGYGLPSSGANQILVRGQGESYTVLFLTSRGAAGGWAGYMYVAADAFHPDGSELTVERIRDHWYWVESS